MVQQLHVHHGHFVHDHRVAFKGVVLVPDEHHVPRAGVDSRFQQPVDGGGVLPRHLRQPFRRPTGGRGQQTGQLHLSQQGQYTI